MENNEINYFIKKIEEWDIKMYQLNWILFNILNILYDNIPIKIKKEVENIISWDINIYDLNNKLNIIVEYIEQIGNYNEEWYLNDYDDWYYENDDNQKCSHWEYWYDCSTLFSNTDDYCRNCLDPM